MTVLVAYSGRDGATAGIAERIGDHIAERGIETEVSPADSVEALDPYDAVVFGAPVLDRRWPVEASDFVTARVDGLASRPLWIFNVGAGKEPADVDSLRSALHLRDYRVFAGRRARHRWSAPSRAVLRHLAGRRDGEVDAWAEEIAGTLGAAGRRPTRPAQSAVG